MSFWTRWKANACSSGGWKTRSKEFVPLLAGIGLTLLAILFARQRISAIEKNLLGNAAPAEIVVASGSIAAGSMFSPENLAKKSVPSVAASSRHVLASDFELLLSAKAKVEIPDGEPVLWTDVEEPVQVERFSMTIPKGRRAMTLDAATGGPVSGLMRPGDRVDILRETKGGGGSVLLLSDVPVIAVDRSYLPFSPEEAGSDVGTVTLSVSANDAARLSAALRGGSISWLLRNPDDHGVPPKATALPSDGSFPVEIWKAGIREQKPPDLPEAWFAE